MGLLEWVRGHRDETAHTEQVRTAATLERIIELTNPRLRFARRYAARLTPAVHTAMEYARQLLVRVPAAHDAAEAAWYSD
ncbi:MAG: hypothetical protein ACXWCY_33640, partial [Burkholderiales bacterium]